MPSPTPTDDPGLIRVPYELVSSGGGGFTMIMIVTGMALILSGVGAIVYMVWRRFREDEDEGFDELAEQLYQGFRPAPGAELTLEEEIRDVSLTLVDSIERLREVFLKAETFEREVRELAAKAEASQAAIMVSEEQAARISHLLNSRSEETIRREIDELKASHQLETSRLKRATFVTAGVSFVAGFFASILAGWIVMNIDG